MFALHMYQLGLPVGVTVQGMLSEMASTQGLHFSYLLSVGHLLSTMSIDP